MTVLNSNPWGNGVSLDSKIKLSGQVLFQLVENEGVLVDLESEQFFGLNRVGSRVWELLGEDPALDRAYATVLAEFDVEPDVLAADLSSLISSLLEAGLVELS